MKNKSWLKYLGNCLLFIIIVFFGQFIFNDIHSRFEVTYRINYYLFNILKVFVYGCLGAVLGLEHFLKELSKKGTWKINFAKLFILGIPSLYFSIGIIIYTINIEFVHNVLLIPISYLLTSHTDFLSVFQLALGYTIITSLYKENR